MTKDEALKLALDALDEPHEVQFWNKQEKAIKAIKEALANEALDKMAENARELGLDYEPAQEPVAWAKFSAKGNIIDLLSEPDDDYTPLYTTPPQRTWVGLTDKEIEEIWKIAMFADYGIGAELSNQPFVHFARAIEAKLKEKNT
jgi:hypothetical protein